MDFDELSEGLNGNQRFVRQIASVSCLRMPGSDVAPRRSPSLGFDDVSATVSLSSSRHDQDPCSFHLA